MPSLHVRLAVLAVALWSQTSLAQDVSGLIFSEYVEGSGNNKALELYNATGRTVDLQAEGYRVEMYFNGSQEAQLAVELVGVIPPGTLVLVHLEAEDIPLERLEQVQRSGSRWFNGNDAVVLRRGASFVDAIGQIGADPGSSWGDGATITKDRVLRRRSSVLTGDTDPYDAFDPADQWEGFDRDDFGGLGRHGIG